INILGGFFIGVVQQGADVKTAAETYTILTIGDGLVSQLPALLISTAAGIIGTRAASGADLGSEVAEQLLMSPRVLWLVSGILGAFALLPGLPFLPFIALAGATGGLAAAGGVSPAPAAGQADEGGAAGPARPKDERGEVLVPLDLMELEVGFELVPLVEPGGASGGDLVERIRTLRRNLALEMGFIVPPVHIRDNLQIRPSEYVILLNGVEVARGELTAGRPPATDPRPRDRAGDARRSPRAHQGRGRADRARAAGPRALDHEAVRGPRRHARARHARREPRAHADRRREAERRRGVPGARAGARAAP